MSVVMLIGVRLGVVMLSVVMLGVIAPIFQCNKTFFFLAREKQNPPKRFWLFQ
jgi:hypothetical protein